MVSPVPVVIFVLLFQTSYLSTRPRITVVMNSIYVSKPLDEAQSCLTVSPTILVNLGMDLLIWHLTPSQEAPNMTV